MGNPRIAREFIKRHLPPSIVEKIDLNSVQCMPNSFVDEKLQGRITDILYKTTFIGEEGYIYLLIEHQRKSDALMPLRLFEYMLQIFRMHLEKYKTVELPLVYPVVLYNGEKPYSHTRDIFEMFRNPEMGRETFLNPFQLIDLNDYSDDDLKKSSLIGAMELFLKHAHTRDLISFFAMIGDLLSELEAMGELDFLNASVYYLFATNKKNLSHRTIFQELQKHLTPPTQEKVMTIAEAFIQDGIEEGLQRGLQQGRQEGRQEGYRSLLVKQITRRFPNEMADRHLYLIEEADGETLLLWIERLIDAESLEAIFCS